jgi:F420-dependent oxidoreductase-like protein
MVSLGVMIEGQEGLTWPRWERLIEASERLGFDALWRSDHLYSVMGVYARPTLAVVPSLTAVALKSSRIEFGALVSPTTFRHPVHLAMEAATLDQLSGGRYWLGVGAGWNVAEHAAFGFALPPLKERMDRFEEALRVITLLWSGESVSFEGQQFQLAEARNTFTPTRPSGVPIIIGGGGEKRTLRLVAEYAQEWNVTTMTRDEYAGKVAALERHCADVGRDPSTIARSLMVAHIIGRDQSELRLRGKRLQSAVPGWAAQAPDVDEMLAQQRSRGALVGTPAEIVEQIQSWGAAGIDRIMLQTHDQEDLGALELFANEVLPQVG